MTISRLVIRRLERRDDRGAFECADAVLTDWSRRYAWQNQAGENAIAFVAIDGDSVVGYYSIAMSSAGRHSVPDSLGGGRPRQVPCILLGRLAVAAEAEGRGLGRALLRDALLRAVMLSESIGAAAVLINAVNTRDRDFYMHNGDFIQSPLDELQLMVPICQIRRFLR